MEASALRAPSLSRRPLGTPLLRLRSDDQLVALFRAGSEEAFAAIHDRYRQRLFAYVRQMLAAGSRSDAEDVLQDVFVRAYGALRADARELHLRAWLYRVAHNRCIDQLRRPVPPAAELFELTRGPLQDPIETAQRRDDLRRLVADLGRLPEQQRSALLMREIDGLSYAGIASALDVTVPAVKSLLVRARMGLVEAIEARDTDCAVIRDDLVRAYDRGVKASSRARRHMRECAGCREYRGALRGVRSSFAALSPAGLGLIAKVAGIGGAGGGGAAASLGGAAGACKVAAVVCTAALAGGTAVEVKQRLGAPDRPERRAAVAPEVSPTSPRVVTAPSLLHHRVDRRAAVAPAPAARERRRPEPTVPAVPADPPVQERVAALAPVVEEAPAAKPVMEPETSGTGGAAAPMEAVIEEAPAVPAVPEVPPVATADPAAPPVAEEPAEPPPAAGPPPEH